MSDELRPDERAVYIISVAAELAGVHPQTLRIYERKGLVQPHRTAGNTRRYSERDIDRLRSIQELTNLGVNLEGVKRIMELESEVERLRAEVRRLRDENNRRFQAGAAGVSIVPLRATRQLPWKER